MQAPRQTAATPLPPPSPGTAGPRRGLLLPLLAALPVLLILLGLGSWQVERLHWKTELLARLAAAEAGPAQPLAEPPAAWTKVAVTGRFRHELEALLNLEVRDGVLGSRLVTPLERPGGPPILVDRGWVPNDRSGAIDRPAGEVRVEGFVHPGEAHGLFSATDDPAGRRCYTFDPPAIAAGLGLPAAAPFGLVAMGPAGRTLPAPAQHLPQPRNSHLGYAITWYGLAAALVGVLVALALRWRAERRA
jgi:surfeit locus 1 family protein